MDALLRTTTCLLACLLLLTAGLAAQELGTAILNGDVTDPQGAVVANAQVTAKNTATSVERTTTSSSAGLFVFNDLVPGKYEVRVEAKGFNPSLATVPLQVGQQINLKVRLTVEGQNRL